MIKIKKYQNGTSLIVQKDKNTKYTSFCLYLKAGAQDEKESEYGVAHFLEHLFFKSTKKMATSEISKYLEGLGAYINASTSTEATKYYFRCLTENFEKCLKMFSEMYYNGKFDKEEIDKERLVVLEEIKKCQDNSSRMAYLKGLSSLYYGFKFEHSPLGSEDVIKNISIEEIKAFKKRTYTADKTFISIYGNLDLESADKMISKYFKTTSKSTPKEKKDSEIDLEINPKERYIIQEKPDKQVNLFIFIKTNGYSREKKRNPAQFLYSIILGKGLSSKLFIELREKLGLAYSTSSDLSLLKNYGSLNIYIGTSPEKVKLAVSEIKSILKDLSENGITPEELQKAKNKIKSDIIFSQDHKLDLACSNANALACYNKIKTVKQKIKKFEKVSLEEVNKIAKDFFKEQKIVVSAIGKGLSLESLEF